MNEYIIYTDGAYAPSLDCGGIGIAIIKNDKLVLQYNKSFKNTTNNRMELSAVIIGLSCIKNNIDKITVVSDSQYVLGCITKGWNRKKNQDLWKVFDSVQKKVNKFCTNIEYRWTKGHSDDKWNNLVDKLAVQASHEIH